MTIINLDNSGYHSYQIEGQGSAQKGKEVTLKNKDGTSSIPLTITELKENPRDGTYLMTMLDEKNNKTYTLTVIIAKEEQQEIKDHPRGQLRDSIRDSIKGAFKRNIENPLKKNVGKPLEKIAKKAHADPEKALRYSLTACLGIAAAPIIGLGGGLKVALNADTMRLAANAVNKGDNGQAALIVLSTQINRLKAAGKLGANLPVIRTALNQLSVKFPAMSQQLAKLNQIVNESKNTMASSGSTIKNSVKRKTANQLFTDNYLNDTRRGRPREGDIFGYNEKHSTLVFMGNPSVTGKALPPRQEGNNYAYYKFQAGQLNVHN